MKSVPIGSSWKRKINGLKTVGIDSMCFIYMFEAHPVFGPLSYSLFHQLEENKTVGCTSIISLAEILSSPKLQKNRLDWEEEKYRFLHTPNLSIQNVDGKVCEASAILRGKYGLALPDSIQIVTSILNRADGFITNDDGFRKVKELPVLLMKDFIK